MSAPLISLIGMGIVISGILAFRMHAFLALVLAAFCVSFLTSSDKILRYALSNHSIPIVAIDGARLELTNKPIEGRTIILRANESGQLATVGAGNLTALPAEDASDRFRALFELEEGESPLATSDSLIHHTQLAAATKESRKNWGQRVAEGLGNTMTKIALLIAMAAIVGKCLMDSGGAERIVLSIVNAVGEKRMPLAFLGSGFTLSIPVFFDTVFYLLMPLGKAMRVKTGKNYLLYVLTIVAGATMAHSLVPPTPGPLFVASEMGIDIGLMMIGGICIGLFTTFAGYLWATYVNSRMEIPLRASEELTEKELAAIANRDESTLPGLGLSLLPILLPIALIGGATATSMIASSTASPSETLVSLNATMKILGDKNIAMAIAAICAMILLLMTNHSRKPIKELVQSALSSGGIIILITAAGGAFGHTLRQTGIAFTIQDMMPASQTSLIPISFFICMLLRTAQGSATVAMITSIGILAPIIGAQDLSYNPLYIALAIGCGSKPIHWMNDSGFWVVTKMSGLTEKEMLKTHTIMSVIMGFTGLFLCMIGARILPLV